MFGTLIEDFKKFTMRGNMIDLAIGFTVGAAFTTVVKSFVNDILMPPIGLLTGGTDFSDQFVILSLPEGKTAPEAGFSSLEAATEAGAVTLNYGVFINSCLSLLIISAAIFLVIRLINRVDAQLDEVFDEEPPPPEEPTDKKCPHCRTMIPYRASRCPNCTSELDVDIPQKTAAATP